MGDGSFVLGFDDSPRLLARIRSNITGPFPHEDKVPLLDDRAIGVREEVSTDYAVVPACDGHLAGSRDSIFGATDTSIDGHKDFFVALAAFDVYVDNAFQTCRHPGCFLYA